MLRLATAADSDAVAKVILESRAAFLPFAPMAHTPAEVRVWVREHLMPESSVTVGEVGGQVVAVLATSVVNGQSWIDQLYVLPSRIGEGLGTSLLSVAHANLVPPIRLYTFQQNERSRRFYERHGYVAVEFSDGELNEERCPDVLYERRGDTVV